MEVTQFAVRHVAVRTRSGLLDLTLPVVSFLPVIWIELIRKFLIVSQGVFVIRITHENTDVIARLINVDHRLVGLP